MGIILSTLKYSKRRSSPSESSTIHQGSQVFIIERSENGGYLVRHPSGVDRLSDLQYIVDNIDVSDDELDTQTSFSSLNSKSHSEGISDDNSHAIQPETKGNESDDRDHNHQNCLMEEGVNSIVRSDDFPRAEIDITQDSSEISVRSNRMQTVLLDTQVALILSSLANFECSFADHRSIIGVRQQHSGMFSERSSGQQNWMVNLMTRFMAWERCQVSANTIVEIVNIFQQFVRKEGDELVVHDNR